MTANLHSGRTSGRAQSIREILAEIFGSEDIVKTHASDIIKATEYYIFMRRAGLKTTNRTKNLNKMLYLCDNLLSEIGVNRPWLSLNLETHTSAVLGTEEIIAGGPYCPLTEFRSLLSKAISEEPIYTGQERMYYRRRLWIWLTYIYEDATDRRAATSNNKDGTVSGNFARYIITISSSLKSLGAVTPDMVHQFVDWYRSAASEQDREEIYLHRSMGRATQPEG